MSPSRVTMTRAEAIRRRREEERKRLESQVQKRISTPKPAPKPVPVQPKAERDVRKPVPVTNRHSRRFDIAMSTPYGQTAVPAETQPGFALHMPKPGFGPRWFSFFLIAVCSTSLYFMLTRSYFMAGTADVVGNNRIGADEISSVLGVMGKPSIFLNPAQIEYNVQAAFPDISTVHVDVNLPAMVVVTVSERQPVAAWQQGGQTVWVDAQGYAFPPRGLVEGLVTVMADGAPSDPISGNLAQTVGAHPFLSPETATALVALSPHVPQGAALIYDPRYGLGWNDPRGWKAFFGHTDTDMTSKLEVYQSMLDYLAQKGIKPTLISVEYPNTPFYRTEN